MKNRKVKLKKLLLVVWMILLFVEAAHLLGLNELPVFSERTKMGVEKDSKPEELLEKVAASNVNIAMIYANQKEYPQALLEALAYNPEMEEFVKGYLDAEPVATGGFTKTELEAEIPLLLQWDKRWGYVPYGSNNIGVAGCGPTCLSMVMLALTGNEEMTPDKIALYSEENGHYVKGVGTSWSLMTEGAKEFGLQVCEVSLDERAMKNCLDQGNFLICAMRKGDFTTSGHFIVIYDYDGEGFWVNDPNSVLRSEKQWDFDTLENQIKNMWAYAYND